MPHLRTPRSAALAACALLGAAAPAAAQLDSDKLAVHGFLTQGLGLSSDHAILGIADQVTSDYRAAALQVRYALTDKDNFVVQLNHRRMGVNPLSESIDDVRLGWGFYQRQLGNGSLKIGKAPVPTGFYNETRFVGTINALYRAPVTLYPEGFETLDGVVLSQRGAIGAGWSLNATGYVGGMSSEDVMHIPVEVAPGQQQVITMIMETRMDRAFGGQLIVETPVQGLRVGVDGMRYKPNDMDDGTGNVVSIDWGQAWAASAELVRPLGALRAEYKRVSYAGVQEGAYYGQGILNVSERLGLVGQAEFMDDEFGEDRQQQYRDVAAGVRYALNPGVVLKVEGHRATGRRYFDAYVAPTDPARQTTYVVTSVSLAF